MPLQIVALCVSALVHSVSAFAPSWPSFTPVTPAAVRTVMPRRVLRPILMVEEAEPVADEPVVSLEEPAPEPVAKLTDDEQLQEFVQAGLVEAMMNEVIDMSPPSSVQNAEAIAETRAKWRTHENDTGSPEYQIATLTAQIAYMTNHLKDNPKDNSGRRGLLAMVARRKKLLKYLQKKDYAKFQLVGTELGIRIKNINTVTSRGR